MHKINKDKAIGVDNISFKPLKQRNSLKIQIEGNNFYENKEEGRKCSKK